jgi:hypothetical protein
MLHVMQWVGIIGEFLSPAVLWLRGRWQLAGALFFLGFHLANTVILGIHFLPTVVCWLAFAPLERIAAWWRERRARRSCGAGQVEDDAEHGRQAEQQAGA